MKQGAKSFMINTVWLIHRCIHSCWCSMGNKRQFTTGAITKTVLSIWQVSVWKVWIYLYHLCIYIFISIVCSTETWHWNWPEIVMNLHKTAHNIDTRANNQSIQQFIFTNKKCVEYFYDLHKNSPKQKASWSTIKYIIKYIIKKEKNTHKHNCESAYRRLSTKKSIAR